MLSPTRFFYEFETSKKQPFFIKRTVIKSCDWITKSKLNTLTNNTKIEYSSFGLLFYQLFGKRIHKTDWTFFNAFQLNWQLWLRAPLVSFSSLVKRKLSSERERASNMCANVCCVVLFISLTLLYVCCFAWLSVYHGTLRGSFRFVELPQSEENTNVSRQLSKIIDRNRWHTETHTHYTHRAERETHREELAK